LIVIDAPAGVSPVKNRPFDPFASEPTTGAPKQAVEESREMPGYLGRYRVTGKLGEGHFGRVYSAYDEELHRSVAIKVPRRKFSMAGNDDGYSVEARVLARLDHPNIVPVYDIERMDDGRLLIVSKFIEGSDFAAKLKSGRLHHTEAAKFIAIVADALHYAHLQGLVHRDIKPANILIDVSDKPYVADFGLALREEDFGKGPTGAGTVPYMSPEQARSEGHRVDGRSDVFSLGVVFYETLTGRRPFVAESLIDLLDQITNADPRPPRQIQDSIPKELERICLKALSKPAGQRYTTAKDMADELRMFLDSEKSTSGRMATPTSATPIPVAAPSTAPPDSSPHVPVIVPKGLRSFDAADADFFPELMPGPRDRDGLPESIRFWRRRIECRDAEDTFAVGLIYGPSGCGKSSMVKAGLLPRLPDKVIPVYVEAATELTEERLLSRLRKLCPELSAELTLSESIGVIRRGMILERGKKVLIVIDQFEQWLHARMNDKDGELIRALRQCDGGRIQCFLLVRDDFWMAISRLMHDLEIRIVEDENSADVDLFDERHAKKVLTMLGRAHGALPAGAAALTTEQQKFIDQAVTGLSQGGKLIPVRLALFSEMVKSREWTPATLKAIGGIEGVGVTFLEEAFTAATAPAQNRMHERAARAVLKMLLPEIGKDIRGTMRSRDELLAASGYVERPKDFEELMRILHKELRLVSPADPQGAELGSGSNLRLPEAGQYYQLTHDYLVPALREWLTRKQRETRKGRAELLLAEQAEVWNSRPANRQLPSFWQWANIRLTTDKSAWTHPQQKMMRKAGQHHTIRGIGIACAVVFAVLAGFVGFADHHATTLVHRLLDNDTAAAIETVQQMAPYRLFVNWRLRDALTEEGDKITKKHLNAALGLLPVDNNQVEYVFDRLLDGDPRDFVAIRELLRGHFLHIRERLWTTLESDSGGERRLRAACALAAYDDPANKRWTDVIRKDVASALVVQSPAVIAIWMNELEPLSQSLLAPLSDILQSEICLDNERSTATKLFERYAKKTKGEVDGLERKMLIPAAITDSREERINSGAVRANIGIALFQMGKCVEAARLLQIAEDPTARTLMIHRMYPRVNPAQIIQQLNSAELEPSVCYCLLLALGEYDLSRLSQAELAKFKGDLLALYRDNPDAGVHGAAEWLARQRLGLGEQLRQITKELQKRDESLLAIGMRPPNKRRWYVNSLGMTMIIVEPGKYFWRGEGDKLHKCAIDRTIAIASNDVTVEQFHKVMPNGTTPNGDEPIRGISWFQAVEFCNRLTEKESQATEYCYEPHNDKFESGMKIVSLSKMRTGYRLPTVCEWDLVSRAGSRTTYSFGEPDTLVKEYAWHGDYSNGKCQPVSRLRPNLFGLFDVHGNISKWCQGRPIYNTRNLDPANIAKEPDDIELVVDADPANPGGDANRMRPTRSGSFSEGHQHMNSARSNLYPPSGFFGDDDLRPTIGMRVVRTIR
jgi:eukaryotic-like serine/threonine-protein kinase